MEADSPGQEREREREQAQQDAVAGTQAERAGLQPRCSSRGGEGQVGPRFILKVELPGFADGSDIANEAKRRAMMTPKVWTE